MKTEHISDEAIMKLLQSAGVFEHGDCIRVRNCDFYEEFAPTKEEAIMKARRILED